VVNVFLDYGVFMLYKEIGGVYKYSDSFLTMIGSILLISNSVEKILFGIIDK